MDDETEDGGAEEELSEEEARAYCRAWDLARSWDRVALADYADGWDYDAAASGNADASAAHGW